MLPLENLRYVLVFGLIAALSGCATNSAPMSQDEFLAAMDKSSLSVDSLLSKGNQEEAVKVLGELAKKNPGRKEPWVRMAKVYFDAENYAQAIVASEEALQRDTTDRTAKSIRAVSGLRVATQSLFDLRSDVELKGNARSDAVGLAKVMRETLGEDVLVPPAELEAGGKRGDAMRAKPGPVPKKTDGTSDAAPAPASSGANPFSVLR